MDLFQILTCPNNAIGKVERRKRKGAGEGSGERGLWREKGKEDRRTARRRGQGAARQRRQRVWPVFRVSTLQKGHPYSRRAVYEGMIDCVHAMYPPVSTLICPLRITFFLCSPTFYSRATPTPLL